MKFSNAAASTFLMMSCIGIYNHQVSCFSVHHSLVQPPQQQRNLYVRKTALFAEEEVKVNGGAEEEKESLTSKLDEVVDNMLKKEEETEKEEEEVEEALVLESVPPASYNIETTNIGPAGAPVTTLTVNLGTPGHPDPLIFQTGKIGRQAAGAITLSRGDTILYSTASRDKEPKEKIDFLPLSVEHQERFSSAGLTSGSYNKRDGRPAEHEILTCRLIDRPLRPLIADG